MARELALLLTERELFSWVGVEISPDKAKTLQCRRYEASLWVDGVGADTIQEFLSLIEETKKRQVQHKILMSNTRGNSLMQDAPSPLGVSPLLLSSICHLFGGINVSLSEAFSCLSIQIAKQLHPKLLRGGEALFVSDRTLSDVIQSGTTKQDVDLTYYTSPVALRQCLNNLQGQNEEPFSIVRRFIICILEVRRNVVQAPFLFMTQG